MYLHVFTKPYQRSMLWDPSNNPPPPTSFLNYCFVSHFITNICYSHVCFYRQGVLHITSHHITSHHIISIVGIPPDIRFGFLPNKSQKCYHSNQPAKYNIRWIKEVRNLLWTAVRWKYPLMHVLSSHVSLHDKKTRANTTPPTLHESTNSNSTPSCICFHVQHVRKVQIFCRLFFHFI